MTTKTESSGLLNAHTLIVMIGLILGGIYYVQLWSFGDDGLSLVSRTTPYWDFNNLWTGGKLALAGQTDALFEVETYRAKMDTLLGQNVPNQEWSYPPSLLLIGAPLAILPPFAAYILWTLAGIAAFHFALRPFKLPPTVHLAVLICPAIMVNALFGQNGALMMALLLAGLNLAPRRPVLAGICFGLMTIKPHLGILIPFCMIASGNWKTFLSAAVTGIGLAVLTGLVFGFDIWVQFLENTRPMMQQIMEAPYIQDYQGNSVTVFIFARMIGAGLTAAYAAQILFALAAIGFAVWLWRPSNALHHHDRVALTAALVLIATPYGYSYDMAGMCAAICIIYARYGRLSMPPAFAVIWLFPLFNHLLTSLYLIAAGGAVCVAAFALLWQTVKQAEGSPKPL